MSTATADHTNTTSTEVRRASDGLVSQSGLLIIGGLVLLALTGAGYTWGDLPRFWHAYLLNACYIASFSIGGLFFVIAHHLFGGRWATTLRRLAEIVAATMWVPALLFVPIILYVWMGGTDLFPWANAEYLEQQPIVAGKTGYLNGSFFALRSVIYFALWLGLANFFVKKSIAQDESGDVGPLHTLQKWSGPAMVLFALSLNFAAFDWLMSLDPMWFSTIFGVYYWIGSAITIMATLILLASFLQSRGVLTQSITTEHYHDMAKLMFAFVVFWGYTAFSQFMLIWYANIPEETGWYALRQDGQTMFGISTVTGALFISHLFIPFLGFMSSAIRRNKMLMVGWAIYMLVVHWFDIFYLVMPTLQLYNNVTESSYGAWPLGLPEVLCLVGVLAVFLGAVLRGLGGKWLMPIHDPRVKQALSYHNH